MPTFSGKKVLITAGPTYEPIDPVRFIGNHSTGKMGYAIAEEFASRGAGVMLVSGPVNLPAPGPEIGLCRVTTASQMYEAVLEKCKEADIMVFAAAVADYRPISAAEQKIKKNTDSLTLELVKNVDIAAEIGKIKLPGQFSVGFALETENEETNALAKLYKKNFDLIVLNSLRDEGAGFGHDTNQIRILDASGSVSFGLKSKQDVARDIVNTILDKMYA